MKKLMFGLCVAFLLVIISVRLAMDDLFALPLYNPTMTIYYPNNIVVSVDYDDSFYSMYSSAYAIRIDCYDYSSVDSLINGMNAREIYSESIGDMTIRYMYSYKLPKVEYLEYGKYNLMIAVVGSKVAIGYPIIAGSY